MRPFNATSIKLKDTHFDDWWTEIHDKWNYEDFLRDKARRVGWISFDCLRHVESVDTVFAGITSFDGDIFWGYDRKNGQWVSTHYKDISDPFDAKFHRSLVHHRGKLYGAVALLHDIDRYWDAPGGAIVEYDYTAGKIEKIGIPIPHVYIQSIVLDSRREIIYGQSFTPERLFSFDLKSREARDLGPIGSGMVMAQAENIVIDDDGFLWGSWGVTRAWQDFYGKDGIRLFRFNTSSGKIAFLTHGLPDVEDSSATVKVDAFFNFHSGSIYASGLNGYFYRVDTRTGSAVPVFKYAPNGASRLSAMALSADGFAYGIAGKEGDCRLIRFDPKTENHQILGKVVDQDGVKCWQIHDITVTHDGVLYAGENDVPHRSAYLWEILLKEET